MKALGILAGPRKGHAADMMIDSVLNGLKERGAEIEKINLYELDIKPCLGCYKCAKTGRCVIEDGHRPVLDKMDVSDVVVFGSPTYWSNISSEAKKFFDRSICFFEETKFGPKRRKKNPSKVVLITSCGVPYPFSHIFGIATGAMQAMKVFFGYMSAVIYPLYATGMIDPEKSRPSKRQLERAYSLGKSIAA